MPRENQNPIRAMFNARKISHEQGLTTLQELGLVSEQCQTLDDIHPEDARNACYFCAILFNYNFWCEPPWKNVTQMLADACFVEYPVKFKNLPFREWR